MPMPNDSIVRQFHGEDTEREFCLGQECPTKNCAICPANRDKAGAIWDADDSWRKKVKTGYYSTTIVEVVDSITGEKKYVYSRPGD